jgi:RNA polymerase sigma-70 factor (ECF subfamily)
MTEADLIRAAKQGDEKAFTEIFNLYKLPLYYFILRRIRNETDAEDLTMETFERAFASIVYFVPLVKLSTWLHEIAKNRTIDFMREKKRTPPMTEPDFNVKDTHTPDRICICSDEFTIIQEGIRTLKNDVHKKLMIMYCEGWKMREMAAELKMPMGTVQNYIHRSKLKLRRLVA